MNRISQGVKGHQGDLSPTKKRYLHQFWVGIWNRIGDEEKKKKRV